MGHDNDDLPPSYQSLVPSHTSHSVRRPPSIADRLAAIHASIQQSQSDNAFTKNQRESDMLQVITSHVDDVASLLSRDVSSGAARVLEFVFVPQEAVGTGWVLSDVESARSGRAARRVIRIPTSTKLSREDQVSEPEQSLNETSAKDQAFDGWGWWDDTDAAGVLAKKSTLWWKDGGMACRLSKELQREASGLMDVFADEVTFRRENEMGLWESCSGWGIIWSLSVT